MSAHITQGSLTGKGMGTSGLLDLKALDTGTPSPGSSATQTPESSPHRAAREAATEASTGAGSEVDAKKIMAERARALRKNSKFEKDKHKRAEQDFRDRLERGIEPYSSALKAEEEAAKAVKESEATALRAEQESQKAAFAGIFSSKKPDHPDTTTGAAPSH